jgi:hypothetical protein
MKGGGYGVSVDSYGMLGGIVGGWVFGMLGIWPGAGIISSIIAAFVGAGCSGVGDAGLEASVNRAPRVPDDRLSPRVESTLTSTQAYSFGPETACAVVHTRLPGLGICLRYG